MLAVDFEFDDMCLSDFGLMVAHMSDSEDTIPMSSTLSLNTIKNKKNKTNIIVSTDYEDVLSCSFDIIRIPCAGEDGVISDEELSRIIMWLQSEHYCKFKPIYTNDEYPDIYYYGTFTSISLHKAGPMVIGLSVTFIANAPYGFSYEIIDYKNVSTFSFDNFSDNDNYVYPKTVILIPKKAGNIILTNTNDNYSTEIKNLKVNEEITLDSVNCIISSSDKEHENRSLFNDFNYKYPRLIPARRTETNSYTCNIPIDVRIEYEAIRKVGLIL